jgi:hypothetical protein
MVSRPCRTVFAAAPDVVVSGAIAGPEDGDVAARAIGVKRAIAVGMVKHNTNQTCGFHVPDGRVILANKERTCMAVNLNHKR